MSLVERKMSSDSDDAGPIARISLAEENKEEEEREGEEEEAYCCYRLREGRAEVRIREVGREGLSFKVWPAAWAMCEYLEECFGERGLRKEEIWRVGGRRVWEEGERAMMRILELGSGTGLVGMVCAAKGAHCTLTDLPHVTPNLRHNAALNAAVIAAAGGSITVRTLRWGHPPDIAAILNNDNPDAPFDLILASDVVYHRDLFSPLLFSLSSLLLTSSPPPIVLLSHLRRWKHDALFFKKASKLFHLSVLHRTHTDVAATRTSVAIYRLSRRDPPPSLCSAASSKDTCKEGIET